MDSKETLKKLIDKIPYIESKFSSSGCFPGLKTINDNSEFIQWRTDLVTFLNGISSNQYGPRIIAMINDMNGYNDEEKFVEITTILRSLYKNIDEIKSNEQINLKKGLQVVTAFNEYTLEKQIGEGGNGKVWKCCDEDEKHYALKFLERTNMKKIKRFKNEVYFGIKNKDKNENILPIFDYGAVGNRYIFYVMPLYEETLRQKIQRGIDPNDAIDIFIGIIKGLHFAHDENVIHRDIKPENILFSSGSNIPIIADFGIAHFSEDDLVTIIETKKGERMANFQYAAPEQRKKDGKISFQTDIYSAGLILNEMFTQEVPQASGYKTIKEVNKDFDYLDRLFEELFKQKPEERLYPEDKILSELNRLTNENKNNKLKKELKDTIDKFTIPSDFTTNIIDKQLKDAKLFFTFDKELPDDWYYFIKDGSYSATYVVGYGHDKLEKINKNVLAMPLKVDITENTLKDIVTNMREWVNTANIEYTRKLKRDAERLQKEEELKRRTDIERLEKENRLNNYLSML